MSDDFKTEHCQAGNEIYNHFIRGIRQCALIAKLQSGKTNTFQYVIRKMLMSRLVKQVIIISGMSDNDLKTQAEKKIKELNSEYKNQIAVKFNRDLPRIKGVKDTLIVLDESHYGSTKNQAVDKFLERNGIAVDGNIFKMEEYDNYILTVSATPFAELSDYSRGKNHHKEAVFLKAGDGYLGIHDFYMAGNMHPIFKIKDFPERFIEMIQERKYYIGRFHKQTISEEELQHLCDDAGVDMIVFAQTSEMASFITQLSELNEKMENAPERPTLIVIKGKLRAGCVLDYKTYIGWVWENSTDPKTDTIMQGLVGRCCGYNSNMNIQIYISEKLFLTGENDKNEIERYIDMLDEKRVIPQRGNHIIPQRGLSGETEEYKYARPAFAFDMKEKLIEAGVVGKKGLSVAIQREIFMKICEYIRSNRDIVSDEYEEIAELGYNSTEITYRSYKRSDKGSQYTGNEGASIMRFIDSYQGKVPYRGNQGIIKNSSNAEGVTYKRLTIAVVYPDYEDAPEYARGNVYCVVRCKKHSGVLMPYTTEKEIYYPREHEEGEVGRVKACKATEDMRQKSADDFIQFIDRRFSIFGRPSETQAYDDNLIYYIVSGTSHQVATVDYFSRKGFKIEFKYKRGRRSTELAETDKVISQVIISIKK
jgi:hypothetical protein